MRAFMMLASMVTAQCSGGSCSMPSSGYRSFSVPAYAASRPVYYDVTPSYQTTSPQVRFVSDEPVRNYDWYQVNHQGLAFKAWGYLEADGKTCRWSPTLKENAANYKKAIEAEVEAKTKKIIEKAEKIEKEIRETSDLPTGVEQPRRRIGSGYSGSDTAKSRRFIESTKALSIEKAKNEEVKPFFTVIGGSKEELQAAAKDWNENPDLADARKSAWFNSFDQGDWQVDPKLKYTPDGRTTFLVQSPGEEGQVHLRAEDKYPGATVVAAAIRKAKPGYDPAKDPTPAKLRVPANPDNLPGIAGWLRITLFVALGLMVLAALIPKRK